MQQTRQGQEGESAPYHPRYNESIRVFTLFFAAVLGFGLKHLLDNTKVAQNPVWQIHLYKTWGIYILHVQVVVFPGGYLHLPKVLDRLG